MATCEVPCPLLCGPVPQDIERTGDAFFWSENHPGMIGGPGEG